MNAPEYAERPRTELREGFGWIGIGALIVFGAWRMDRMTQQGGELFTAPGLWPGIIGLCIALLGGVLAWRSVLRARAASWTAVEHDDTDYAPTWKFRLAASLFFTYAILLVGHGLPFWLGTSLFVAIYIFVFRRAERMEGTRTGSTAGDAALAIVCGVATAVLVTVTFEQVFFVRLP